VKDGFRIVDMDLHVMEPVSIWERLREPYRSRTQVLYGTHGHQEQSGVTIVLGDLRFSPSNESIRRQSLRRFQSGDPADAHLAAINASCSPALLREGLDWEGIDVAAIVSTALFVMTSCDGLHPDYALALCEVFNDWCAELVAADRERFRFWAWLPRQDGDLAAQEARRAVRELGADGVVMTTGAVDGRLLGDPCFEPLWFEAESLNVPVGLHLWGANPALADDVHRRYWGQPNADLALLTLNGRYHGMTSIAELVFGGALERHPGLRISVMEAGNAWLLDLLQRMDEKWEMFSPEAPVVLPRPPSDYVRRQCYVTCEGDDHALRYLVDYGLEDNITFSTDYPHHDAPWPHAVDNLLHQASLADDVKRKILWENPQRLFAWERQPAGSPS
jgi:predicted TIM-barrel fold metal-dependent hydrolase